MFYKIILRIRILICKTINNPVFIIKIENGIVSKVSGSVKNSFLNDCIDITERNNLKYAIVYAEKGSYGKPILKSSFEIPKDTLQQLRNTWSFNS